MSFLNYSPSITFDNDLDGDISMRNIRFLPIRDIEFIPFNFTDEINIKFITALRYWGNYSRLVVNAVNRFN